MCKTRHYESQKHPKVLDFELRDIVILDVTGPLTKILELYFQAKDSATPISP